MSNTYTPASSQLVALTWAGGSSKGAWNEIIASTTDEFKGFNLFVRPDASNKDDFLLDICRAPAQ